MAGNPFDQFDGQPEIENLGVVPVADPNAPIPPPATAKKNEPNPFDQFDATPATTPSPSSRVAPKPAPEPSFGEKALRKGLGTATAITEIFPGATQAAAGLRSALGNRTYEDELSRVREEQQMMRKLEPVTTGVTRGAGNVALSVPAMALGGPLGLAALTGAQALSRGEDLAQAGLEAAIGGVAGPFFSRAPAAIKAALPVLATAGATLGAKDESALWEAITGLVPSLATTAAQAGRKVYRGLSGRAEKAGEQLLSSEGAKLAAAREERITGAEKEVASAEARRRALTGEQQSRLANAVSLENAGMNLGFEAAGTPMLPEEALPEAKKAYESFFRNAPAKFVEEAARVAEQQAAAQADLEAAQAEWADPLAMARSMKTVGPVTPGPVPPDLEEAARYLRARSLEEASTRVPTEIKDAAKSRALVGVAGAVPSVALGNRALGAATVAGFGTFGAGRKIQQLLATDPKTKLFKDPAAANVIYDVIPSVVRKFPTLAKYASLVTDAGIRARPVFLLNALRRDPDFARAVEEEVTGEVTEE